MRGLPTVLALLLLSAAPAVANEGAAEAPKLTPAQLQAIKKQLDAAPQTPGRAAMMPKLLKVALAVKNKQPVAPEDLMALVAFLRESNAGKKGDPAFEGAMQQLEGSVMRLQGGAENSDLEDLKKEFEGY